MTIEIKLYTSQDLLNLSSSSKLYELVKGELREMSPAGRKHGKIDTTLTSHLFQFVSQNKLGEVYGPDTGFIIETDPDTVRSPDVSFVAGSRLVGVGEDGFLPFAPDLAVEVMSPSDRMSEVEDKIEQYQNTGVRLVWVINPRRKIVQIYHPNDPKPQILGLEDELDGEDVVAGFKLPVKILFD